ncbi:MAG: hypothetical protein ACJA0X_003337 [Cyclobacteriaceae bacterium]|jgi:hypothetical protein
MQWRVSYLLTDERATSPFLNFFIGIQSNQPRIASEYDGIGNALTYGNFSTGNSVVLGIQFDLYLNRVDKNLAFSNEFAYNSLTSNGHNISINARDTEFQVIRTSNYRLEQRTLSLKSRFKYIFINTK